jgi:hypothetical protein
MTRALATFILLVGFVAGGALAATCTQETLEVQGTPVRISYCVTGPTRATAGQEIIVPVAATFSAPGGSLQRTAELHFLAGESTSRVLENLDLSKLGLAGTLHLTLAYVAGSVRVEGALLTPGAITIK